MCIRALSGNLFNFNPIVKASNKSDQLIKIMYMILFLHLGLSVLKASMLSFTSALGDFFACIILFFSLKSTHFCNMLIYMVTSLMSAFQLFVYIGMSVQSG